MNAPAMDIELAMLQGFEQGLLSRIEEVQAFDVLPRTDRHFGLTQALQISVACTCIVKAAKKCQVALVATQQYFTQIDQTVDRFLERSEFPGAVPVPMFHLAVVLEKGNVVDRRFNTQHTAEFVIDLDAGRPHAVLDAASLKGAGHLGH